MERGDAVPTFVRPEYLTNTYLINTSKESKVILKSKREKNNKGKSEEKDGRRNSK